MSESPPESQEVLELLSRTQLVADLFDESVGTEGTAQGNYLGRRVKELQHGLLMGIPMGPATELYSDEIPPPPVDTPISAARKAELADKLRTPSEIASSTYPFKNYGLDRNDIIWLVKTYHDVDLRGADMRGQDLRGLDLHGLRGGLTPQDWIKAVSAQIRLANSSKIFQDNLPDPLIDLFEAAAVNLQGALLDGADLSDAILNFAQLDDARCYGTAFRNAKLLYTQLQYGKFGGSDLSNALISHSNLYAASLVGAHLEGAQLDRSFLARTALNGAYLSESTNLQNIDVGDSEKGFPYLADIRWGSFRLEQITWENLGETGDAWRVTTSAKAVRHAVSQLRALKRDTQKSAKALIKDLPDHEEAQSAKIALGNQLHMIDDKILGIRQQVMYGYESAARTARQISVRLEEEAITDVSKRFGYEAERLRRRALGKQFKSPGILIDTSGREGVLDRVRRLATWWRLRLKILGTYVLSSVLWALSGYGYKPGRAIIAYFTVILAFATGYFWVGRLPFWPAAVTYSVTSFHGRGFEAFFPGLTVSVPHQQMLVTLAAGQAIVGLVVEIVFIATFTKRFFER